LLRRGAQAVFVAAQKIDGVFRGKEHVQKHTYPFHLLFDEQRQVTRAYGVHHAIGIDAVNIARRATFVVGPDGKICSIAVSAHQREAPELEKIFAAIEACGKY
jgi:peroxiredoxin